MGKENDADYSRLWTTERNVKNVSGQGIIVIEVPLVRLKQVFLKELIWTDLNLRLQKKNFSFIPHPLGRMSLW